MSIGNCLANFKIFQNVPIRGQLAGVDAASSVYLPRPLWALSGCDGGTNQIVRIDVTRVSRGISEFEERWEGAHGCCLTEKVSRSAPWHSS